MIHNSKSQSGFTLVELVVAISIFITLVTVAAAAFIQGVRGERRMVDLMAVADNAGIVLEQITREIRTGYDFCGNLSTNNPSACESSDSDELTFTNFENKQVTYTKSGEGIVREEGANSSNSKVTVLTADNISVSYLKFFVTQNNDYCNPWRITVIMSVTSPKVNQTIPLQTTISSRILPVEMPGISSAAFQTCSAKRT